MLYFRMQICTLKFPLMMSSVCSAKVSMLLHKVAMRKSVYSQDYTDFF